MTDSEKIAVLILAGGKSTRMGTDKLKLKIGDETLLRRVARVFTAAFDRVYVSVGEAETEDIGLPTVRDIVPGCGPLSGLHAALATLDCSGVFLVAADMPLARPDTARMIIEAAEGYDVCCAGSPERPEPLFAFYRRGVLPHVEAALASGRYNVSQVMRNVNTRYLTVNDTAGLTNVNTPEEYEKLKNNY